MEFPVKTNQIKEGKRLKSWQHFDEIKVFFTKNWIEGLMLIF